MASRDLRVVANPRTLVNASLQPSPVWMVLCAAGTFVQKLAANPLLASAVGTGIYVSQYWIRKRVAAAIFLIRTYREKRSLPTTPALTPQESPRRDEDDWSPRADRISRLEDLDPADIRRYAEALGVDPRTDVDLVERVIEEILQPAPPPGWELHRTTYEGLRFVELATGEMHVAHPNCVDALEDIRRIAMQTHGGMKAVHGNANVRTSHIDEDKIFRKFLSEAANEGNETPRGKSQSRDRHEGNALAGWATQSLRAAVTSIRDIVKVSARPEIVKEAAVVAADCSPSKTPNTGPKLAPPPPPPPPPRPVPKAASPPQRPPPPPPPAAAKPATEEAENPRDRLLEDIRKGVTLKHVDTKGERTGAAPRPLPPPRDIHEELQRKFGKKKAPEKSEDSW